MAVMSVCGSLDNSSLGIISPHEHIFIDMRVFFNPSTESGLSRIEEDPVSIEHLGLLKRNPFLLKDNVMMLDQKTQTNEMNRVFFAFGSTEELKEAGILQKSGGFFGIGKTLVIEQDFNQEYFTPADIRDFDFIPLMVKKANLLSIHSAASYHISGEKNADTLFIDNKNEFWKATKYLIIATK